MSAVLHKAGEFHSIWKKEGLRALFRRYGWRLVAGLFAYYLIRDLTIYLLVPFFLVRALG